MQGVINEREESEEELSSNKIKNEEKKTTVDGKEVLLQNMLLKAM